MSRLIWPIAVFLGLVLLLGIGLTLNPREVPSPLIGKSVPEFDLPAVLPSEQRLTEEDLRGRVSLLNVWATWCVPCRDEHPVLVGIAQRGEAEIYGLNYKDDREAAQSWLKRLGNPYRKSGFDPKGRAGIDLGVYGVPETFIVGADGRIVYKHIGPIDDRIWREELLPRVEKASRGEG